MIEHAHNSRLKSHKPCKQHSGHPSTGGACIKRKFVPFYEGVGCVHISTVAYTSTCSMACMGMADPSGKRGTV